VIVSVGPFAVLGTMKSASPARGRLLLERVLAVEQHDHVGVLLERAGLAQVGDLRLLVGALLGSTVELADGDDRDLQLLWPSSFSEREISMTSC
jgi:hypothetical protein